MIVEVSTTVALKCPCGFETLHHISIQPRLLQRYLDAGDAHVTACPQADEGTEWVDRMRFDLVAASPAIADGLQVHRWTLWPQSWGS